jgi:hypothetical protein
VKLPGWFKRSGATTPGVVVQQRAASSTPMRTGNHVNPHARPSWWRAALPLNGVLYGDDALWSLLEEMRRSVPLVDRSVSVLAQLVGEIRVKASPGVKNDLERWMETVKVNQAQQGLTGFLRGHLESMLLYGKGVGEMVPTRDRRDIYALTNLDARSVLFKVTDDPLKFDIIQRQRVSTEFLELPEAVTLISLLGGHVDRPHGVSIFRACPFVIKAMRTIENATAQLWERVGAPPFHINVELDPAMDDPEGTIAAEVLASLKSEWDKVMGTARDPESGTVADYFTAGKVTVRVAGAEGPALSITEPFRTFAEQVICCTGLPSWFLGMHWSATERLAGHQVKMLLTQIEALRRQVMPEVQRIVATRQMLAGKTGRYTLEWESVNLQDALEQATAESVSESARSRRILNCATLWSLGYVSQQRAADMTEEGLGAVARAMETPPPLPGLGQAPPPDGKQNSDG